MLINNHILIHKHTVFLGINTRIVFDWNTDSNRTRSKSNCLCVHTHKQAFNADLSVISSLQLNDLPCEINEPGTFIPIALIRINELLYNHKLIT